jgi:DNA polymerase elongation subunit (family B)
MSILVLDVETVGATTKDTAAAIAEMAEAKGQDPAAFAALCPPLARVVCVALLNLSTGVHRVYLDGEAFSEPAGPTGEPGHFMCDSEAQILSQVSLYITNCIRIVTFNGRSFDLPVLVHRSLAKGVTASSKLLQAAKEYRFKPNLHIDLREAATFFGASNTGSLRAFCLGYGLGDPKANGNGKDVASLVEAKDHRTLGRYCLSDVRFTAKLYELMKNGGLL